MKKQKDSISERISSEYSDLRKENTINVSVSLYASDVDFAMKHEINRSRTLRKLFREFLSKLRVG